MRGGKNIGLPTIKIIVADYIRKQQRPVHCSEAAKVVSEKRSDLRSKNIIATVRSVMQDSPLFNKKGPGLFDLKEK